MKRNAFALLFILGLVFSTELKAQYRHYRYAPRRPYVRVVPRFAPRIFIPPPVIGFSWGYGPRVYVTPPPIIIGGGRGWRHYHRRGYNCNDRCHRWSDDNYYRYQDRRNYDDRDSRYDRNQRYYDNRDRRNYDNRDRRYNDNDRYYNRLDENPSNRQPQPKTYNTDEDAYDEESDT